MQILKEVVPAATNVAFLGTNADWNGPMAKHVRAVAPMLGVTLVHAEVTPNNYADAFALITQDRPHALYLAAHPTHYANRQMIVEFTVKQRIPAIFSSRDYVEGGGLMSYGINTFDLYSRAAGYVVKILKGAKPADLPVEQPTKFVLAINLKTAKILGLTIPAPLLAIADEVIE